MYISHNLLILKGRKILKTFSTTLAQENCLKLYHVSKILEAAIWYSTNSREVNVLVAWNRTYFSKRSFLIQFYILYLIWLIIMLGLVWKQLLLIVKLNCAPLHSCLAAFEILCGLGCGDASKFCLCQNSLSFLSNVVLSVLAAKWLQRMSDVISNAWCIILTADVSAGLPPVSDNSKPVDLCTLMEQEGKVEL